jgi:hypothetical protein
MFETIAPERSHGSNHPLNCHGTAGFRGLESPWKQELTLVIRTSRQISRRETFAQPLDLSEQKFQEIFSNQLATCAERHVAWKRYTPTA